MSQPSRGVRLPIDGLTGWGEAARRVGEGVSAVLTGTARVLQERAQVSAAGELASFSARLKAIDEETREELAGQEVQDWNYAWQTASAPKLAEAINELSPDSREAAHELAQAYNAKASLAAQRDYELGRIDRAREQWRSQLNHAVETGDARQAQEWLRAGQGIFVPETRMPQENETVESRVSLSRWKKGLQETPLLTLSELSAAQEYELPRQKTDAQRLTHARSEASRFARREVLSELISCMDSGVTPDPDYLKMAVAAGVLTQEQSQAALQEKPAELTRARRRIWLRRIDECPDDEESAEKLRLDIAAADMPVKERQELLSRVEQSRNLPAERRISLSRELWSLYQNGALGCPGDDIAQQEFARLQQDALARLNRQQLEETAEWLSSLKSLSNRWVCFEPGRHT